MLLAIDIGNTHSVFGLFRNATLAMNWRIATSASRTEDECWMHLKLLCGQGGYDTIHIRGAVISSVVPDQTDIAAAMVKKYTGLSPVVVSGSLDLGMAIRYRDPMAVGADRLCSAVAAYRKYKGPAIVVDFGTATTFDVISRKGEYLGGVIAPGVETAAADLQRRAAKLPKIDLRFPDRIIGTETISSMQAGILYGAVDAMEGMIRRIRKEIGKNAVVIATGGYSRVIAQHSALIQHLEPDLVLEGARLIYERVTQKKR